MHCVGLLAAIPPATVQRLLGGRAGRQAADRARGVDPRPVTPRALPASASVSRTFPRHTLDGAAVRAALLHLVVTHALQLRRRGQAARGLTLSLRFAGGTTWEKTLCLPKTSSALAGGGVWDARGSGARRGVLSHGWRVPRHDGRSCCCDWPT
ncbi:DinB/UmuC family translesion DNA polymerase [Streptomyces mirabilis]|uniref:ImpB/mucB/samB family C-terminal domain-containing protein n=1 Tax=Streptomyces mirabilis TaxID=68239 RepID=A0A1I2L1Y9_9ACTN|nr:impB/mucB/samB family C-terminal domain-containing protein [Streptomyces mirabilis]